MYIETINFFFDNVLSHNYLIKTQSMGMCRGTNAASGARSSCTSSSRQENQSVSYSCLYPHTVISNCLSCCAQQACGPVTANRLMFYAMSAMVQRARMLACVCLWRCGHAPLYMLAPQKHSPKRQAHSESDIPALCQY